MIIKRKNKIKTTKKDTIKKNTKANKCKRKRK